MPLILNGCVSFDFEPAFRVVGMSFVRTSLVGSALPLFICILYLCGRLEFIPMSVKRDLSLFACSVIRIGKFKHGFFFLTVVP